jgi:hypothetical protein
MILGGREAALLGWKTAALLGGRELDDGWATKWEKDG